MCQRMNESQLYEQNTVCNRKSKKTGRFDLEGLRQPSILLVELDEIILTQRTLKRICTIKCPLSGSSGWDLTARKEPIKTYNKSALTRSGKRDHIPYSYHQKPSRAEY